MRRLADVDAGVVDEDVDAAEFFGDALHHGGDRRLVGDVGGDGDRLDAARFELGGRGRRLRFIAPDHRDVGAGFRQPPGHAEANAAIAAGDDSHLAGEIEAFGCHVLSLRCRAWQRLRCRRRCRSLTMTRQRLARQIRTSPERGQRRAVPSPLGLADHEARGRPGDYAGALADPEQPDRESEEADDRKPSAHRSCSLVPRGYRVDARVLCLRSEGKGRNDHFPSGHHRSNAQKSPGKCRGFRVGQFGRDQYFATTGHPS